MVLKNCLKLAHVGQLQVLRSIFQLSQGGCGIGCDDFTNADELLGCFGGNSVFLRNCIFMDDVEYV